MSEENVEIVRQSLNAWVEVDEGLADRERMYEFFAPDVVFNAPELPDAAPGGGELHGIDELLEWRAGWIAMFEDWSYSPERFIDAGANRVLVTFHQRGKLRGTEDWLDMHYGIVYVVEEGRITEGTAYITKEAAFEAAGLSE